jgi:hypothetical protein
MSAMRLRPCPRVSQPCRRRRLRRPARASLAHMAADTEHVHACLLVGLHAALDGTA